ncbi:unnamed protein product [Tenebrio molitor]|nr:unnamed protein product [Tenebrio molitor]
MRNLGDVNYKITLYVLIKTTISPNRMNFEDKTLTITITNPEIRYELDYETKGVMFLMPIDTSGSALVNARNVTFTFTFTFEEYTKDGKNHLLVVDTKLEMAPQSMSAHFENLLRDKDLNDAFSREMSLNWKISFGYFAPIYLDSYGQRCGNIFNTFLEKVPVAEIFDGL